jgi:LysR family hydrogen peroxide-inducible transcriptional activator
MPMYLQENFTVNLGEQLRRGDLDAIIVALPFSEPGIVSRPVYDEPFCVVMPTNHPMAMQAEVPPDQIAGENLLLLGQGNCFRDQVVQACPHLSEPGGANGALEGSSLETVRHMVASGVGISVVPISAAKSWPQNGSLLQYRDFTQPAPFRRVGIAWRASFPRPQAIDVLRAAILDAPPPGVSPIA